MVLWLELQPTAARALNGRAITRGVRTLVIVAALAAALAAAPVDALVASATAAPTLDIRAQTQLVLEKVQRRDTGLAEITGRLVDKLTGDGIADQSVTIVVAGEAVSATTGPDGRFRRVVRVPAGPQAIELSYSGGALIDAASHATIADPSRATVALSITVDRNDGELDPRIQVFATADDKLVPLEVELSVGAPTDPELRPWKTVTTGDAAHVLTQREAGGPGTRRIRASFRGDETLQPATAEVTVELYTSTRTEMKLSATELAYEDELTVTGRVTDAAGKPVPRASVTLVSGDRRLAQSATNSDGTYAFEIEAEIIGQGQYAIQVQTDPGSAYVQPSRTDPAIVRIAEPQPVPVSYTIAAFVATLGAAGGFFLARGRPWRRFRRSARPAETPPERADHEPVLGGLVTGKPGVMSSLRRAHDDMFAGVVRDAVRGRAIGGALVRLRLAERERETVTGADGSFALAELEPGVWSTEVVAPGHVTETFTVTIPHRGELRGVRIDLVPVRERVFQLYRRAAEPALPEPRLWGIWSPRQIVEHVRAQQPSPALAELTDFVEEVYFSPRLALETVLPQASERVERAVRERART